MTGEVSLSSPALARWELAVRLRQRRLALGVNVASLARDLGFTRNYWSAVENDRAVLAEDKLRAAAGLLEFSTSDAAELFQLRDVAKGRAWWNDPDISEALQQLYGFEAGAARARTYEGMLITGLLQTEGYVAALSMAHPGISAVDVAKFATIRARRQERLTSDAPLKLTAIMGETVLRLEVGGPEVFHHQLLHLLRLIDQIPDTLDVRIMPFAAPVTGLTGASTLCLLDFASPHLPVVVWQENMHAIGFSDESAIVRPIELAFDHALDVALSRDESMAAIEQSARNLERQRQTR